MIFFRKISHFHFFRKYKKCLSITGDQRFIVLDLYDKTNSYNSWMTKTLLPIYKYTPFKVIARRIPTG